MEFLTNPWVIFFNILNIAVLIFLVIKRRHKNKQKPLLFERLRALNIHPTIRKTPKPFKMKGGANSCSKNLKP